MASPGALQYPGGPGALPERLPVFEFSGSTALPGEVVEFNFFEPRYVHMARAQRSYCCRAVATVAIAPLTASVTTAFGSPPEPESPSWSRTPSPRDCGRPLSSRGFSRVTLAQTSITVRSGALGGSLIGRGEGASRISDQ